MTAPVLAWLAVPGAPYRRAIDENIDLAVHTIDQLHEISSAAADSGHRAQIHLKVDTGMGRGGAATDDWPGLVEQARAREGDGLVRVAGIWSHLASADEPGEPSIGRQLMMFDEALEVAARGGVRPDVRHIANSAATLYLPEGHYDMVRPGIAVYGVDLVHGRRCAVAGRVCMDQFVIDIGDEPAAAGDDVVLFGPGDRGEPTATDWAAATGTIAYEILTRIGGRVTRIYTGSTPTDASATETGAAASEAVASS